MKYFLILISILFGIYLGINHPKREEVEVLAITPTVTPSPTPTPGAKEVIEEITEVWGGEKTHEIVTAITCAYSESGLRVNALNTKNSNGTKDHSVFQVNDINSKRYGEGFKKSWRENIRVAYQIYKNRGWSAWYGSRCN